jgi:hypothetical protein
MLDFPFTAQYLSSGNLDFIPDMIRAGLLESCPEAVSRVVVSLFIYYDAPGRTGSCRLEAEG